MNDIAKLSDSEIDKLLSKDVLSKSIKSCLPRNLPAKWIEFFLTCIDENGRTLPDINYLRRVLVPLSFIVKKILIKQGKQGVLSDENMKDVLSLTFPYLRELVLENGFRKGDLYYRRSNIKSVLFLSNSDYCLKLLNHSSEYISFYKRNFDC